MGSSGSASAVSEIASGPSSLFAFFSSTTSGQNTEAHTDSQLEAEPADRRGRGGSKSALAGEQEKIVLFRREKKKGRTTGGGRNKRKKKKGGF